MSAAVATSSATDLAIEVVGLSKVYRDGFLWHKRFPALQDVSFNVQRGEVFGLLGPNGAGKTTFLKILLGIIKKTAGRAAMLSYPAGSRQGRRHVGYLPEQLRIPRHLTGLTALEYYGSLNQLPKRQILARRENVLDLVGLTGRGHDSVKKYSKGMLQRLGLAQALLPEPKLLVLDEPTDGLDPRARAEMRAVIRHLRDTGVTVFLNSHILQEVELICDRVAILDRGYLRYSGPVSDIGDFVKQRTGQTQLEVELELIGPEPDVRGALGDVAVKNWAVHNDRVLVTVGFDNQGEVDQCVDRLRSQAISLVRLARHTVSLEQAFLQIVDDSSPATKPAKRKAL